MGKRLIRQQGYFALTAAAAALMVAICALAPSGSTQSPAYTSYLDVEYANVNGTSLKLDLYVPDSGGPFPVVVWIHGGGWQAGDKSDPMPAIREASRGYAVVSINYRLQVAHPAPLDPNLVFPVQIQDSKAAVRWLRANAATYNLDPNRIGAWGESAGGHLSSLLGTSGGVSDLEDLSEGNPTFSSRVKAVVDWYGPTDLLQMDAQTAPECGPVCHNCADSPESYLIGCAIQTCPALTERANPISYVTADDAAFLIMHGTADCVVPPGQSQLLYDALQGASLDSTLYYVQGAGHGGPEFADPALLAQVDAFLDRTLAGFPTPTPTPTPGSIVLTPSSVNLTTTVGVDPADQTIDVTSSEAWSASTSTSWLRIHCPTGNCGGSFFVVQIVTSGLTAGSYSGSVAITSGVSSAVLPVTLTITFSSPTPTPTPTPTPSPIVLTPSSVNLITTVGVDPAAQTIDVTSPEAWSASTSTPWLRIHCATGNCGGSFFVVKILTSGLTAGFYLGSVVITSGTSSAVLPVTLTITSIPTSTPIPEVASIEMTPTSLSDSWCGARMVARLSDWRDVSRADLFYKRWHTKRELKRPFTLSTAITKSYQLLQTRREGLQR